MANLSAFLLNDSDDRPLFLIIPLQFEPENPPIAFKKPTTRLMDRNVLCSSDSGRFWLFFMGKKRLHSDLVEIRWKSDEDEDDRRHHGPAASLPRSESGERTTAGQRR